jgi:hypothetical protein
MAVQLKTVVLPKNSDQDRVVLARWCVTRSGSDAFRHQTQNADDLWHFKYSQSRARQTYTEERSSRVLRQPAIWVSFGAAITRFKSPVATHETQVNRSAPHLSHGPALLPLSPCRLYLLQFLPTVEREKHHLREEEMDFYLALIRIPALTPHIGGSFEQEVLADPQMA